MQYESRGTELRNCPACMWASGSTKSDLEAMAKTIDNPNRRQGERRGSVGISTLVYRSTLHLRQEQPTEKEASDSEPLLHRCPSYVAALHLDRYPQKSNPLAGWLNACCST